MQQFEYMSIRKIEDQSYVKRMQDLFINNYLELTKIKMDNSLRERINIYYCWTALRTATMFFLKEQPEPERAHELLNKVRQDLKLN